MRRVSQNNQTFISYLANRPSCLLEDLSLHLLHDSCNIFMMFVITLPRAGDMMYHPHPESSNTQHDKCINSATNISMSNDPIYNEVQTRFSARCNAITRKKFNSIKKCTFEATGLYSEDQNLIIRRTSENEIKLIYKCNPNSDINLVVNHIYLVPVMNTRSATHRAIAGATYPQKKLISCCT